MHHYSLPIVPFLVVAIVSTLAANRSWLRKGKSIILWMLAILFLGLTLRLALIDNKGYLFDWSNWQATQEAIAQVKTKGSVLTTHEIAPHVTHRPVVKFYRSPPVNASKFDYILLNLEHASLRVENTAPGLVEQLERDKRFQLTYQKDKVYLFEKLRNS